MSCRFIFSAILAKHIHYFLSANRYSIYYIIIKKYAVINNQIVNKIAIIVHSVRLHFYAVYDNIITVKVTGKE